MILSQTKTNNSSEYIFLIAILLLLSQLIFVLLDRKKDMPRTPTSSWSVKMIQVFIGLQGLTIFSLPWMSFNEFNDIRLFELTNGTYNLDFSDQILFYASILFCSFSLMISSSMFQILFKVRQKSLSIYLFEMTICCVTLITGVLLMNYLQTNFSVTQWPMRIGGIPFSSPDYNIRYGICLIFVLGTVNALLQSILFFQSTGKKNLKVAKSNPELLDIIE